MQKKTVPPIKTQALESRKTEPLRFWEQPR